MLALLLTPGSPSPIPPAYPRRPVPVAFHLRRLVVSRGAVDVGTPLRPAEGPFSQAAFDRWERAENRWRRERRRALWLALHGIDVGPSVIHGVVVR